MKRYPQPTNKRSISVSKPLSTQAGDIGIVLSGGGSRAAYQVGALKALSGHLDNAQFPISAVVGSSIGAINGLLLAACLKAGISTAISEMEDVWKERTFRNTFKGSPSSAFFRAIRVAVLQYMSPGPNPSSGAVFDPSPLMARIDGVIRDHGGLQPENRSPQLQSVAVMTTIEGSERKPLLFLSSHKKIDDAVMRGASFEICYVDSLSAKHGFASAALPSVLPPVEIDTDRGKVRLVDGGISQNVPVDPAVRLGAARVIVVDISGRDWWLDRYREPHDTRPEWEVKAGSDTFCLRPPETFVVRCRTPLGPVLRAAVGKSSSKFIHSVGPVWPVFSLLKNRLGEDVAYEVMSYVALDPDYIQALIEQGYNETTMILRNKAQIQFEVSEEFTHHAKAG